MNFSGKVLWYDSRDGYGQIKDDAGVRYYFDSSVIKSNSKTHIKSGAIVSFEINPEIKKPLCAKNVTLARLKKSKKNQPGAQLPLFEN